MIGQICGCRSTAPNPCGSQSGRFIPCKTFSVGIRRGIQSSLVVHSPTPLLARRPLPISREAPLDRKRLVSFKHVVARARELVRHRLDRHRTVAFSLLPLIEPSRGLTVTHCEIRCLDESPREVTVAVLGIALALLLAVGYVRAAHTAAVRGVIAHIREAIDAARLQQDDGGQHLADPVNGFKQPITRLGAAVFGEDLLKTVDLYLQRLHHGNVGFEPQALHVA